MLSGVIVDRCHGHIIPECRICRGPDRSLGVQISRAVVVESCFFIKFLACKSKRQCFEPIPCLFNPGLAVRGIFDTFVLFALAVADQLGASQMVTMIIIRILLFVIRRILRGSGLSIRYFPAWSDQKRGRGLFYNLCQRGLSPAGRGSLAVARAIRGFYATSTTPSARFSSRTSRWPLATFLRFSHITKKNYGLVICSILMASQEID